MSPGAKAAVGIGRVSGSKAAPREQRLSVYAQGYASRVHDALAEDYPAVRAVLGEPRFRQVVAGVLLVRPSTSFTLADVGESLPDLLPELLGPGNPAWVTELARLERAVAEVTFAEVSPPLDPGDLPRDPEVWDGAKVVVSPALRLLHFAHPVDSVWRAAVDGSPLPAMPLAEEARSLVVVRDRGGLWVEAPGRDAWEVLADVRGGRCLGTTCARLGEASGSAERVATWFRGWMERGWFSGVVFRNARARP